MFNGNPDEEGATAFRNGAVQKTVSAGADWWIRPSGGLDGSLFFISGVAQAVSYMREKRGNAE